MKKKERWKKQKYREDYMKYVIEDTRKNRRNRNRSSDNTIAR